jgi:N-acyl homoserine lactone hydrolase
MKATKVVLRVLAGLAALTVVAIAGLALTFTPAKLELPPVDVGNLPPTPSPAGMSISALPTGTYDTPFLTSRVRRPSPY